MRAEPAGESGGLKSVRKPVWKSGCPDPPGRPRRAIRRTIRRTIRRRCAGTGKPPHAGWGAGDRRPTPRGRLRRAGTAGYIGDIRQTGNHRPRRLDRAVAVTLHVNRCPARSSVRRLRGRGLHRMLAMTVRYGCPGAAKGRGRKPGGEDPGRRFSGEASAPGGDVAVALQDAPRLAEQALDPRLHPAVGLPLLADVVLAPEPDRNVAMRASRLRRRQRGQKLVLVIAPAPRSLFEGPRRPRPSRDRPAGRSRPAA